MNKPAGRGVALIGTGALALEIVELISAEIFSCSYTDPQFLTESRVNLPVHTDIATLRQHARYFILGIAVPQDRIRITAQLMAAGFEPADPLILTSAAISPSAIIGKGSVIGHGVQIGSRCQIGEHNLLMHNVVLGHDVNTAEHVIFSPGVFSAGYVNIEHSVIVNANATLAKGIQVGNNSYIAQGAACFRSIPAGSQVIGNPARVFSSAKVPKP